MRRGTPLFDNGIRAGIVHHTATPNEYAASDSAGIVRGIYSYHTTDLGWGDIAYNSLVDRTAGVRGRFGASPAPSRAATPAGSTPNTWAVAMIGNFDEAPPTTVQLQAWANCSDGDLQWHRPTARHRGSDIGRWSVHTFPTRRYTHPGSHFRPSRRGRHRLSWLLRLRLPRPDPAHRRPFNKPRNAQDLADSLRGGAIYARCRPWVV